MIVTVSLNPAVDKTCNMISLRYGEINRIKSVESIPGGKGINVSACLNTFGDEVLATGFIGGGAGAFIEQTLAQKNIKTSFVYLNEETRTNMTCITSDGKVTEILEAGPVVTGEKWEEFLTVFKSLMTGDVEMVCLSGSLPEGVPVDAYGILIDIAKEKGIPSILDTSGDALRCGVAKSPYMVKPNLAELDSLLGLHLNMKRSNDEAFIESVQEAILKLTATGIERIVVTLGNIGIVGWEKDEFVFIPAPIVEVVNTVGSGDSVVAALAHSYLKEESLEVSIKKAVAISAASVTTLRNVDIPKDLANKFMNEML